MTILILIMIQTAQSTACVLNTKISAVPNKFNLKLLKTVAGAADNVHVDQLVKNDPRLPIVEDRFIARYPEVQSVARVSLRGANRALTGTLVTKCHVLINLHLLSAAQASVSSAGDNKMPNLLKYTDKQLSQLNNVKFDIGFLPNGKSSFDVGYDIPVTGKIAKTGRIQPLDKYDYNKDGGIAPEEDWAIIRINEPAKISRLYPVEIASDQEIAFSNDTVLMVGYPAQRIKQDQKERAFVQKCKIDPGQYTFNHTCVATGGNSSSPALLEVNENGTVKQKISGLAQIGKYSPDNDEVMGVPAYAFRGAVEEIKKSDPCN